MQKSMGYCAAVQFVTDINQHGAGDRGYNTEQEDWSVLM